MEPCLAEVLALTRVALCMTAKQGEDFLNLFEYGTGSDNGGVANCKLKWRTSQPRGPS